MTADPPEAHRPVPGVEAHVEQRVDVIVHPDAQATADVSAGRLLAALLEAQALRGAASVVLTGGGTGTAILASLAVAPGRDALDWGRVDVWWGDERWVGDGDPDRNEGQAREALLDRLPLDPARVHPILGSDHSDSPAASAADYAEGLGGVGEFDVCLLGVGPEGHVASLFPMTAGVRETERPVVGVLDCPKPPAERVSMTLPRLRASREVWFLVTGEGKADAVARLLAGATAHELPAAGATGRLRTLLLCDRAAAATLR